MYITITCLLRHGLICFTGCLSRLLKTEWVCMFATGQLFHSSTESANQETLHGCTWAWQLQQGPSKKQNKCSTSSEWCRNFPISHSSTREHPEVLDCEAGSGICCQVLALLKESIFPFHSGKWWVSFCAPYKITGSFWAEPLQKFLSRLASCLLWSIGCQDN